MPQAFHNLKLILCIFSILGGFIKINPVYPVNPVKKFIVKNSASAHTLFMQNKPNFRTHYFPLNHYHRSTYGGFTVVPLSQKQSQFEPNQSQFEAQTNPIYPKNKAKLKLNMIEILWHIQ